MSVTRCGNIEFYWGKRTYVMGIVNISPDSFSGDGLPDITSAVIQAQRMVEDGADILDVGGESTRPGSSSIQVEEELARVIPVIEKLSSVATVPVSVDTYKWEVAAKALEAGATMLNDQWGLKREPRLGELAAKWDIPIILMSNQRDKGSYDTAVQRDTSEYADVMSEVISSHKSSVELALSLGVPHHNIILDPGIGFGKTWQQDIEIVRRLRELKSLDYPVLMGPSRKSLIKMVLNLPANDRIEGTAAVVTVSIVNGADIVRVHDVKQMVRVCRMTDAIVRSK